MAVNITTITSPNFSIPQEGDIEYPEEDGKPMAETDFQRDPLTYCVESLKTYFADTPQTYVSGNLLVYYEKGNPKKSFAPDVFVVLGVSNYQRRIYKIWEEGKAPDVVIEILSKQTWKQDTGEKKRLYSQLGIKEYFLYDPLGTYLDRPLAGYWLDKDNTYQPINPVEQPNKVLSLTSHLLGLALHVIDGQLRFYNPDEDRYLYTYQEEHQARLEEHQARLEERQARLKAEKQLHQTVRNMLAEGLPNAMISRLTGLTTAEIEKLIE